MTFTLPRCWSSNHSHGTQDSLFTLLQLPARQAAQGLRWQWRAGWGRLERVQSSSLPELQRTILQMAPRPQVVEHCGPQVL